jgi:hypothetical protein
MTSNVTKESRLIAKEGDFIVLPGNHKLPKRRAQIPPPPPDEKALDSQFAEKAGKEEPACPWKIGREGE